MSLESHVCATMICLEPRLVRETADHWPSVIPSSRATLKHVEINTHFIDGNSRVRNIAF